ncbi:hypothetical protein FP435_04710 [Lactobacillus sp. PV037]|uniref:hypothetical protein n=1 Tax=Lactobacillus sp. PV037 TaxID=2594496 RepID=UPI00223FCC6F|nr:hypothetical protein [Lactobacillus sp. PV037]QNQ83793.1 hypothetical protein FP435_04710 [Lactobacillus sp. PV037]
MLSKQEEDKKRKLIEKGYQFVPVSNITLFERDEFFDVISPTGRHIMNGVTEKEIIRWLGGIKIAK